MSQTGPISSRYFKDTNTLLYSYLSVLPLFILYEILIIISQPDSSAIVRISVDVWFKSIFMALGLNALSFTFYIAALAGAVILYKSRRKLTSIKPVYFFWMLLEAVVYAIVFALLISSAVNLLLNISADGSFSSFTKLQLLALSLGAGLYEELFFRVILVGVLVWLFSKVFEKKWLVYFTAAILAATLFSAVHYIGEYGDSFALGSFLFRFLFGLALNVIYVIRGFGMAAWTHALYDIIVILGS
jgi:membrane protease YdiL (CAAX protease family)